MTQEPNATLDITGDNCPMTFVKTKLMLEELEPGQILEVIINAGEPIENVPRSVENEGHKIISIEPIVENEAIAEGESGAEKFRLLIEKGAD